MSGESKREAAHTPGLPRHVVRDIFLAAGFTIKPGQTDLKPYVYAAADALIAKARAPDLAAEVERLRERYRDALQLAEANHRKVEELRSEAAAMRSQLNAAYLGSPETRLAAERRKVEALEKDARNTVAAWDRLGASGTTFRGVPNRLEGWLRADMHPAISSLRAALAASDPQKGGA